jgi:hypothetical protein
VSPVKYKQDFYIPEDDILHSGCRENQESYNLLALLQFLHPWKRVCDFSGTLIVSSNISQQCLSRTDRRLA